MSTSTHTVERSTVVDADPQLSRTYSGPDSGRGAAYAWSGNPKTLASEVMGVFVSPDKVIGLDAERGLAQLKAGAESA